MKRPKLTEREFSAHVDRLERGAEPPSVLDGYEADDAADLRLAGRLLAMRRSFAPPQAPPLRSVAAAGGMRLAGTPAAVDLRAARRSQRWRVRSEAAVLVAMLSLAVGTVWQVLRIGARRPPEGPQRPVAMLVPDSGPPTPFGGLLDEATATAVPTDDPYPGPGTPPGTVPTPGDGTFGPATATAPPTPDEAQPPYPGPGDPTRDPDEPTTVPGQPTPSSVPPPREPQPPTPTNTGPGTAPPPSFPPGTPWPTATPRPWPSPFGTETPEPTPTAEETMSWPTEHTTPVVTPLPSSTFEPGPPETPTPWPSVSSVPPPPSTPTDMPPPSTPTVGALPVAATVWWPLRLRHATVPGLQGCRDALEPWYSSRPN